MTRASKEARTPDVFDLLAVRAERKRIAERLDGYARAGIKPDEDDVKRYQALLALSQRIGAHL